MKKIINIYTPSGLRLREAGSGEESRTIEGYALKFGVESVKLLEGFAGDYYEVLERGCLTKDTLDKSDIKLTMFHDRQLILARSNQGTGTLSYEVDETGVKFAAEMPHTVDGDKALELVKRGDLAGCSFAYTTDEDDSENCVSYEKFDGEGDKGRDKIVRHVKRIDAVYDFTLAADPAYPQTEVSKREVMHALGLDEPKPEPKPEEPKVDEAKKRENIKNVRKMAESSIFA